VEVNSSADGFDPVVGTDLAALERTQAAVVARELQTRVAALQGPEGPLATMALQKHPAVDRRTGTPVLAWWSPGDGEIGYPDRRT
jgi:hypothetical protein